jgi:hypothetical protein
MATTRTAALILAAALACPATAQQKTGGTAGEVVVIPGLPGVGPNQEVRIAGGQVATGEITGPEVPFTARVVQWEEGRSVTVRLPDGATRVVPVPSTILFPPGLRPGGDVTLLVRQTSDGTYRVTGMTTGPAAAATMAPATAPAAPAAAPVPPGAASPSSATVSMPPSSGQKGGPPTHGKSVVRAAFVSVAGKVTAYEKGTSITVKDKKGKLRTLKIAEGATVPEELAVGDKVVVNIPLGRPADGKTVDRVEREKPKQTPVPSKFKAAESPKS